MAGGRPKKPAGLKALAGNPGRRPLQEGSSPATPDEPPPQPGEFEPPKGLTAAERKVWREEVPRFLSTGLARPSDIATLRAYCEARALYLRAKTVVDRDGLTYSTETGYVRERPEVKIMTAQARLMTKLSDQLTQNPKARIAAQSQYLTSRQYQLPLPDPAASASPPPKPQDAPSANDPVGWLQ